MLALACLAGLLALAAAAYFRRRTRARELCLLALFLLFSLELIAALLLFFWIYKGDAALVAGHQKPYDLLIRIRLLQAFYGKLGDQANFWVVDPDLGYRVGTNKAAYLYTSNSAGMRGTREFATLPTRDRYRIATFGDSFVFGDDEVDDATWQVALERRFPKIEALNFGTGGYGFHQAAIRYLRDGTRFFPQLVVFNRFGFYPNRDSVESYLPAVNLDLWRTDFFRTRVSLTKAGPRWQGFTSLNILDPDWREYYIYRHLDAFNSGKTFAKLLRFRPLYQSNFLLLTKILIVRVEVARGLEREKNKRVPFTPCDPESMALVAEIYRVAERTGSKLLFLSPDPKLDPTCAGKLPPQPKFVYFYDIQTAFHAKVAERNLGRADIYNKTNHYTRLGNEMYAELLAEYLQHNRLIP